MRPLLILLLTPVLLWAQEFEFQFEPEAFPVAIDGWQPFSPWSGGESESTPTLCDIDGDSDLDYFSGNFFGHITCYENRGNTLNPDYFFITKEYANVTLGGIPFNGRTAPEFCDLNGDGDYDLFTGDGQGLIHYWENIGTPQNPLFDFITDTLALIDVPGFSKLDFKDLDSDGDYDLLIGNYFGTIWHYTNTGTPQEFNFSLVTEQFSGIDVGDNASPCLIDIDSDSDYDLFVGERYGRIWYYENRGTPDSCAFIYITDYFDSIDVGDYASPDFADINGDGDYDLFVGREPDWVTFGPGDVFFYENIGTSELPEFQLVTKNYLSIDEGFLAKLDFIDIDADEDQDLFVTALDSLRFYRNVGNSQSPSFIRETSHYQGICVNDLCPFFCDIDADGDFDLFCGSGAIPGPPGLYLFINRGTPQVADFVLYSEDFVPGNYFVIIYPSLADIDNDGDYDLFLCDQGGSFYYYENTGGPLLPNFVWRSNNWQGIDPVQLQRCSRFWDFDDDGDLDLLFNGDTTAAFYRNIGTPDSAVMVYEPQTTIEGLYYPTSTYVWGFDVVDIDADGDGDFFGGNGNGGVLFFRNVTGQNEVGPSRPIGPPLPKLDFCIGPNPANPVTWISFSLPAPQEATLAVYNILGAKITTLASGLQMPGTHNLIWNASQYSSGVYIIRLETPQFTSSQRVTVVK